MLNPEQLIAFLLAAIAITATPGPDNLMVLGMSVAKGRARGLAFGLGCAAGCLSHTVLAVLGVGALVAASPLALTALRVVGGLYLMWLGVQSWRGAGTLPASTGTAAGTPDAASESWGRLFAKGLFANAINPKVVLFFLSFLPQFVDPDHGPVTGQLAVLGVAFSLQAAVLFGLLAFFAGSVGQWLTQRPTAARWLDRVAGTVFVALGARLVAER
jgi:threonine/homoserine/homoserine lactone efflux protein